MNPKEFDHAFPSNGVKYPGGMTNQQIVDSVVQHLLTQRRKSEDSERCRYRHGNLRCAVGCLISDENYIQGFEGHSVDNRAVSMAIKASTGCEMKGAITEFLAMAQHIHDAHDVEQWHDRLADLCHDHGFAFNPPADA